MEQELMDILTDLRPDVDFETETALIDDHILESFDIVSLVAALNDAFDIEIGAKDLVPENFNSAQALFFLRAHPSSLKSGSLSLKNSCQSSFFFGPRASE